MTPNHFERGAENCMQGLTDPGSATHCASGSKRLSSLGLAPNKSVGGSPPFAAIVSVYSSRLLLPALLEGWKS